MGKKDNFVLGKQVEYKYSYDPGILRKEMRLTNRKEYDIDEKKLPFIGVDVWHAYECSFLLNNGAPVNGILKLSFPCDSKYLVESKSLKLYLFSFNMEKIGATVIDAIAYFEKTVKKDLSKLLETEVTCRFFREHQATFTQDNLLKKAVNLNSTIHIEQINFNLYKESPDILQDEDSDIMQDLKMEPRFFIKSDMLRSNCKITKQSDFGTVYIYIGGKRLPSLVSVAQYIVSMRQEYHFHEEIVECIYSRLWKKYSPSNLLVAALYTRRGGIDICPVRANRPELFPQQLMDVDRLTIKEYRS